MNEVRTTHSHASIRGGLPPSPPFKMAAGPKRIRVHAGGRPSKHPWQEIEDLFVQGEDVSDSENVSRSGSAHKWPSQTEIARRYGTRLEQVSRRFARVGEDGKTVHDRRENFQAAYQRHVDDMLASDLAGRVTRFREASLTLAEIGLRHIGSRLIEPNSGGKLANISIDDLAKLATATKRLQEVGMVALDRPANGPDSKFSGETDWSLMREVRAARLTEGR